MEKLVYVAMAVCIFGLLACLGGLWLLHLSINAGNVWQGIVAAGMTVVGGYYFVVALSAWRP